MGSKQSTANSPSRNSAAVDIHNRPTRANTTAGGESSGSNGTSTDIQQINNNGSNDQRQRARSLVVIPGNSSGRSGRRDMFTFASNSELMEMFSSDMPSYATSLPTNNSVSISVLEFNRK